MLMYKEWRECKEMDAKRVRSGQNAGILLCWALAGGTLKEAKDMRSACERPRTLRVTEGQLEIVGAPPTSI